MIKDEFAFFQLFIAELLRARSARSGASWVRKYGNLCFQEILVLRKSSVRTSTLPCWRMRNGTLRYYQCKTWYQTSMLWSVDSCQKVSADQCHMTLLKLSADQLLVFNWSLAHVNFFKGRILFALCLRRSIIKWGRHFLQHSWRTSLLALAKSIYQALLASLEFFALSFSILCIF